jgi:hypothetical protein
MTCKQQRRVDEDTGIATYVPHLEGKKLTQGIAYLFDEVFAIRVEKDEDTGEPYHILQCHKDRKYEAKDRSGELNFFEEPKLKKVAAKILGQEITSEPVKVSEPEPEKPSEPETTETPINTDSNDSANNDSQETAEAESSTEEEQGELTSDVPSNLKTFVCCDCDASYESEEEPEACTNGDCTSNDFYEA